MASQKDVQGSPKSNSGGRGPGMGAPTKNHETMRPKAQIEVGKPPRTKGVGGAPKGL